MNINELENLANNLAILLKKDCEVLDILLQNSHHYSPKKLLEEQNHIKKLLYNQIFKEFVEISGLELKVNEPIYISEGP